MAYLQEVNFFNTHLNKEACNILWSLIDSYLLTTDCICFLFCLLIFELILS